MRVALLFPSFEADTPMPGIVEFPQVVAEALQEFADLLPNEPQRRHFAEYLTGLYVADRKNVSAINREFANAGDQSCLNRFLTDATWDEAQINQRRLELLQEDPATRYSAQGIIPIDNTLIDHTGKLIEDAGWFWDHAEERYKIAHDDIFVNYVCTNGKHYPLDFRRFQKAADCASRNVPFQDHTRLCQALIDWVCAQNIPGTFAFDSYFTNAPILNHIQGQRQADGQARGYVGSLKFNRKLEYKGRSIKASELAKEIAPASRKPMQHNDRKQWYFTCTLWIPDVNHKVRILIIWQNQDDDQPRLILVTNRVSWEASRIVRAYRQRWTGTETFHRDGKQQLGMGDCQLRDGQGQTRHMYLVMVAYSLLMKQLRQGHAYEWAYQRLTTIGQACRAIGRETLRTTLTWAIEHVQEYAWNVDRVMTHLDLLPNN
jgi:DDE superfamily endonuclease